MDRAPPPERVEAAGSVWVDARHPDAASFVRRIQTTHPGLPCVLILPGRGRRPPEPAELAVPVGTCLTVLEDRLPGALVEVLDQVDRERRLRRTLQRLNERLTSSRPAGDSPGLPVPSDRYLALLLTHVPDAILSADRAGKILISNDAAEETFGYRAPELAGTPATALAESEDVGRAGELLDRAARGEAVHGVRIASRRRDGSGFPGEWTVASIPDERGETLGFVVIVRNVERQSRLEEAQDFLQELSRSLAETLDYQETLVLVAELSVPYLADWCILDVVEGDEDLRRVATAHADPSLLGVLRELQERFPPGPQSGHPGREAFRTARSLLLPDLTEAVLAERTVDHEHRELLSRLGSRSLIAVPLIARNRVIGSATFVRGHSGRTFGAADVLLAEDVGRRAALAVSNARLYREAQQALADREELTAIVSHDLRNPLNAAVVAAAVLEQDLEPEKRRNQARVLQRSLQRMAGLLDDLIELSRIDTGRLVIEREPMAVDPLLQEACEEFQGLAAEQGSTIVCPETHGLPDIQGDRHRLLQVLGNLLGNALKFSPPGEAVELLADAAEGEVRISVRDRGPGLDPDERSQAFERFWQGRRGDRQGLGLGLAIARGLVEAHGGRIWIESTPGAGATFHFTVPAVKPSGARG